VGDLLLLGTSAPFIHVCGSLQQLISMLQKSAAAPDDLDDADAAVCNGVHLV